MKIRLQDVLDLDHLSDDEWSLFTTGHLDFVVCRSADDMPVFALEIDGLSHQNPKQISLDILKNRLCSAAGLPLLRLGIDALDETTEVSVLEWLVERFVSWQEQGSDYRADSISPIVHHVVFPFPGNLAVTTRLFNLHRTAVTVKDFEFFTQVKVFQRHWLVQAAETFRDKAPYQLEVQWPGTMLSFEDGAVSEFAVARMDVGLRARGSGEAFLHKATGEARFAWAHKTQSASVVPPHALIPSAEQLRALGLFAPDLPWLDAAAIAEDLAIYDALSQIERWAETNLGAAGQPLN